MPHDFHIFLAKLQLLDPLAVSRWSLVRWWAGAPAEQRRAKALGPWFVGSKVRHPGQLRWSSRGLESKEPKSDLSFWSHCHLTLFLESLLDSYIYIFGKCLEWKLKVEIRGFGWSCWSWTKVKIDGKQCESQDFLDILSRDKGSSVELSLERPLKHLLYLKKPGRLGLDLMYTKVDAKPWRASVKPWIASITHEGLVAEWNANMPELAVGEHDRIISINSKVGSPGELVDVLSAANEVIEMEILHYNFWILLMYSHFGGPEPVGYPRMLKASLW